MTGLVRKATFFVACAMLLGAAASFAGIVSPGNCTVSANRINLVGYDVGAAGDQADSLEYLCKLTVTVRDIANNVLAGVPVVLDFSGCVTGDVGIGAAQSYHAQTLGCVTSTIQNYSTTNGEVAFVVVGGRVAGTAHAAGCAEVYADSYLLGTLGVGTYDQTGSGGFTLADISLFWTDVNDPGPDQDRTDVDGNGSLTLADISYAWTANAHAASFNTSSVTCP